MKKIFILLFAIAGLTQSCKKTYTCECTTITTFPPSVTGSGTATFMNRSKTVAYNEKMKEKQAKSACDHEAETLNSTLRNGWTENNTQPQEITSITTCAIR